MPENERTLGSYLDGVNDKHTFLDFVRALAKDRQDAVEKEKIAPNHPFGPSANGWENGTIEAFLEAAVACATGAERLAEEANWRTFAEFLFGGKIYE